MGDAVLIYFGYPQAHEDDAERAVRAGLELVAAVVGLKTHAALQTRIGIATGLVVVGDLIGSGASREQAIVGETPNLAARLQGIAEPNVVVIAEGTRRLLANLFELEDLGAKELKGITGSVRAWAPLRLSSAEGRFEAMHASGLTALIGREEELELLLRRWSRAKAGNGQVVLLSGEAGIGKSRPDGSAVGTSCCGATHAAALFLLSAAHRQRVLSDHRPNGARRWICATTTPRKQSSTNTMSCWRKALRGTQDAALFAEMLSLPNGGRYPTLELEPQQRRQKTLEALTARLAALSQSKPGADDFRGRALDRPDEPGSAQSRRLSRSERLASCSSLPTDPSLGQRGLGSRMSQHLPSTGSGSAKSPP